jgi:2-keto-3-deoxy-L-rhamnonate aldolase RhmA
MNVINDFRQKLRSGRLLLGAGITFTDPLVTESLSYGVDFIWIDREHSDMSPEALNGHLLAARARNIPALVRVTGSYTHCIKPVLDAGANGIIAPQVRSVEEVMQVVADCRYPPLGHRGFGPRVPSNYGRIESGIFAEQANNAIFVGVMIENVEALNALDDILAVPMLDSIVIGPWDLSAALGVLGDVEHPKVVEAINMIISKTRAAGLAVGVGMGPDADYAYLMAKRGVHWIQLGVDYGYMNRSLDQLTMSVRARLQNNMEARGHT